MRILPIILAVLITATAYAAPQKEKSIEDPPDDNDVGLIGIRENIPPDKMPYDPDNPNANPNTLFQGTAPPQEEFNPNSFGLLNIPGEIQTKPDVPPSDTDEGGKISFELSRANEPHKEHKFHEALAVVEGVRAKHPEIPMLWEWRAIYLDLAGEYEASLQAWEEREKLFPFENTGLEKNYYKAEALYQIGEKLEADKLLSEAYQIIDKGEGDVFGQKEKTTLLSVFNFLLLKNNRRTPQAIEALWKSIPANERDSLGNYHGFNLSELWYWYGDMFGRKDIIKKFTDTERMTDNEDVIKVLKEALYAQER